MKREPERIEPFRSTPAYPIYGRHFIKGRERYSFDISVLINHAAKYSRLYPVAEAATRVQHLVTDALIVVDLGVLLAALDEYSDALTTNAILATVETIKAVPCLVCPGRSYDPRTHSHSRDAPENMAQ